MIDRSSRDEIIQKAVLEKLSDGPNIFSADDILTVAGIDARKLQAIEESIKAQVRVQDGETPRKKR